MFSGFSVARKYLRLAAIFMLSLVVAACGASLPSGPRINASAPVPVALLVPTGSEDQGDADLAQNLENAARLAISDLQGVTIDLRVYSTAGQPTTAAAAAVQAVNDGAKIILGPVFAAAANAAGQSVASRNVNVLAFSNNPAIAGGNVFILGPTFQNTANRLVSFAADQGRPRIQIVHGQSAAEIQGRDAISAAIAGSGAELAGITTFNLDQQGVIDAVPRIVEEAQQNGADAVFLTSDTSGALPFLAQLLPENGFDASSTQLIGLQRWDIPASALDLPGLQGGWFARPDPGLTTLFADRYQAAFGTPPHPIAGLAYDGIAAIGALVAQGKSDALTKGALTQSAGFAGVNGVFRLLPDGTNERALAVAQVIDGQVVTLDPAPRGFGFAGF